MITIGIDPHKRSLTAAALDPSSRPLGQLRVPVTAQAGVQLRAWAATWPERRWAIEGAGGLGRGIAQLLVAAGETVIDVPAKLAARARLLGAGNAHKTDQVDAASVAAAAIHNHRLGQVAPEGDSVIFRLLSDRRDDLVAERTRTLKPPARAAGRPAPRRRRPPVDRGPGRDAAGPQPSADPSRHPTQTPGP